MIPSVISVEVTGPHRLRLAFDDGATGELDLATLISWEGVFAPLRDPAYFAKVRVDQEAGTISWPNGADLDPLVLHSRISGVPVQLDVSLPGRSA